MEYKKKVVAFNMKKTDNLAVILFFASFFLFGVVNVVDKRTPLLATGSVWWDSLVTFGVFIVGMFLHEGIHALSGMIFGRLKAKDIAFGFDLRGGNLYTHFAKPMPARAYGASLIMPCVVTAILPIVFITAFGSPILLASACLLLAGCAADITAFFSTLKADKNTLICDHPTALAYYLCYPENALPEGFTEATEEEEKELLKDSEGEPLPDGKGRKKSLLLKCLAILAFIAVYVLAMYLISHVMKNI